jgi:hypothetical protein
MADFKVHHLTGHNPQGLITLALLEIKRLVRRA